MTDQGVSQGLQYGQMMPVDEIAVGDRIGQLREITVLMLMASIKLVGLVHPIVVTSTGKLVAGLHRMEACKRLGRVEIPVTIVPDDDVAIQQAIEVEENRSRNHTYTILEQGEMVLALEAAIVDLGARAPAHRPNKGASAAPLFTTAAIGKELGLEKRRVQERKQVVGAIPEAVRAQLRGTSIGKRLGDLKTLGQLTPEDQANLVDLVVSKKAKRLDEVLPPGTPEPGGGAQTEADTVEVLRQGLQAIDAPEPVVELLLKGTQGVTLMLQRLVDLGYKDLVGTEFPTLLKEMLQEAANLGVTVPRVGRRAGALFGISVLESSDGSNDITKLEELISGSKVCIHRAASEERAIAAFTARTETPAHIVTAVPLAGNKDEWGITGSIEVYEKLPREQRFPTLAEYLEEQGGNDDDDDDPDDGGGSGGNGTPPPSSEPTRDPDGAANQASSSVPHAASTGSQLVIGRDDLLPAVQLLHSVVGRRPGKSTPEWETSMAFLQAEEGVIDMVGLRGRVLTSARVPVKGGHDLPLGGSFAVPAAGLVEVVKGAKDTISFTVQGDGQVLVGEPPAALAPFEGRDPAKVLDLHQTIQGREGSSVIEVEAARFGKALAWLQKFGRSGYYLQAAPELSLVAYQSGYLVATDEDAIATVEMPGMEGSAFKIDASDIPQVGKLLATIGAGTVELVETERDTCFRAQGMSMLAVKPLYQEPNFPSPLIKTEPVLTCRFAAKDLKGALKAIPKMATKARTKTGRLDVPVLVTTVGRPGLLQVGVKLPPNGLQTTDIDAVVHGDVHITLDASRILFKSPLQAALLNPGLGEDVEMEFHVKEKGKGRGVYVVIRSSWRGDNYTAVIPFRDAEKLWR